MFVSVIFFSFSDLKCFITSLFDYWYEEHIKQFTVHECALNILNPINFVNHLMSNKP